MRPLSYRIRGLTRFRDEIVGDFDDLPPGLVAITGENGAGKSTFMDVVSGFLPMHREMSTRPGSLKDHCVGRHAEIELTQAYRGRVYRHLLQIDPEANGGRGQEKAYLFEDGIPVGEDGAGEGQVSDGGVRVYDRAIARIFPPRDVFLASAFATQDRSGAFLSLPLVERKELFAKLLGLQHLQTLADRAGVGRAPLDAAAARLDDEATAIDASRVQRDALTSDLVGARATVVDRERAETGVDATLRATADALSASVALRDQLATARTDAIDRRDEATRTADAGDREATTHRSEIARLTVITDRAADVRDRAARLDAATADTKSIRIEWTAARDTVTAKDAAHRSSGAAVDVAHADATRHDRALVSQRDAERAIDDLEVRIAPLAGLRSEHARAVVAAQEIEPRAATATRNAMQDANVADARVRDIRSKIADAERRAALIDGVPCRGARVLVFRSEADEEVGDGDRADCGSCRFLADARTGADALPVLRADLVTAEALVVSAEAATVAARALAAELADLVVARDAAARKVADLAPLEVDLARHRATVAAGQGTADALAGVRARIPLLEEAVTTAARELADATAARVAVEARGATAAARAAELVGADVDLRSLEAALTTIPLLTTQATAAEERAAAARATAARVVVPPEPADQEAAVLARTADRDAARTALDAAQAATREARTAVAHLDGRLAQIGDVDARATALEARRAAVSARRAGFALVERGFGPRGVQALEIDAAGPSVSLLANELLEAIPACRFSVALRTIQEARAGRVQKEVFDVAVRDALHGRELPVESLSGGEKVLISEALRLALAVFNAQRGGHELLTLFRDESDQGLDPQKRLAYPAMLRRARVLGGFTSVYFISQSPEVTEQADAIIRLADGAAEIEVQ